MKQSPLFLLANTSNFVFKRVARRHVRLEQESNKFHIQCKEPQQKHN